MAITVTWLIVLILIVCLFGAFIYLQIYLSKQQERWKGLILPIISFILSLSFLFGSFAYNSSYTSSQTIAEDGTVLTERTETGRTNIEISATLFGFLYYNIPTVVFLYIFYKQKKQETMKEQMNKMNIQDI